MAGLGGSVPVFFPFVVIVAFGVAFFGRHSVFWIEGGRWEEIPSRFSVEMTDEVILRSRRHPLCIISLFELLAFFFGPAKSKSTAAMSNSHHFFLQIRVRFF